MARGRWKESLALGVAGAALLAAGCAARRPERTVFPELPPPAEALARGYEIPPVLSASELLPDSLLRGPHHRVAEEVLTDGFSHLYFVESDFGDFEVRGDDLLRSRVAEIGALAELAEMSETREFASAMGNALKSPFVATWNLITHPVATLPGIPAHAWEAVRRTADLARGERGELDNSAFAELIGFERVKRRLARQLGVDPYSSNPALQTALNRFAWVSFAGGLPGRFVPFQEPGSGADAGPPHAADRLDELLAEFSPEDLARLNRIELAVMGVPPETRDAFIRHPWYSPRHETLLVGSLSTLDLTRDRGAFIDAALGAESEDDARFFQGVAEMMAACARRGVRIESIVRVGRAVAGYTEDHTLLVPIVVDYAIWSEPTANFADSFRQNLPPEIAVERTELLLSGTLSQRARSEMETRGFTVIDRALERPEPTGAHTLSGAEPVSP